VLATDWAPDAIAMARANAARNGAELETMVCSWAEPAPLLERAPWDLVLASDVLYEARNGEALLPLLPRLGREVWLADPGRPPAARFLEEAARDWTISSRPIAGLANGAVYRLTRRDV
jgi:predicted nicotinamide N-methyase